MLFRISRLLSIHLFEMMAIAYFKIFDCCIRVLHCFNRMLTVQVCILMCFQWLQDLSNAYKILANTSLFDMQNTSAMRIVKDLQT